MSAVAVRQEPEAAAQGANAPGPQAGAKAQPAATRDSFVRGPEASASVALPAGKSWKDLIRVEVVTAPVVSDTGKPNVRASHVGLTVENKDLRKLVSDAGIKSYAGIDTVMSTKLSVSAVPTLVRDSVREDLGERVDETAAATRTKLLGDVDASLAAQRPAAIAAAQAQAEAAVRSNPAFAGAPASMQEAMLAQARAQAAASVDAYLGQLRASYAGQIDAGVAANVKAKKKEIDERLDKLQVETSFQELSLLLAKPVAGGRALVWVKGGKFLPEVGPQLNALGQSRLDALRPVNSATQAGVRTAPTGAVDLGTSVIVAEDGRKLQANVIVAHDRPPFLDGEQYVGDVVTMSEAAFDEHRAFWEVNSVIGRALFSTEQASVYGTVGSYDGKLQGAVGADVKLGSSTHLLLDATAGERAALSRGASAFVEQAVSPRFTVYTGAEYLKGQRLPHVSARADGTVDSTKVVVGAKVNLVDYKKNDLEVRLDAGLEGQRYTSKDGFAQDADGRNDVQVGATLRLNWR